MSEKEVLDLNRFLFRGLHPYVYVGTASDRYAGWIGQIYSKERFVDRVRNRSHKVGGRSFVESLVPVESVEEYFEHFRTLELDFTFYQPLFDERGEPTPAFHALSAYKKHLDEGDLLILKVPQLVCARKILRHGAFTENASYLDVGSFTDRFYGPATDLLGPNLGGFVFEQEYRRKQEQGSPEDTARDLDRFFDAAPKDNRYHVELRTQAYLSAPVFRVLEKHGVGQVLSHWTWLPPLSRQFGLSGRTFLNAGRRAVVRLMTPRSVRYEDAYAKAHPFNALVEGMLSPHMVEDTAALMHAAVERQVRIHVIVNNRAGGNAPLIALAVAERFQAGEEA